MTQNWTPDDIPWDSFEADKLTPDMLNVIKAAAMVERNAADYTTYLKNVFRDDPAFLELAIEWQAEEVQHGDVLGRYAEMADPAFNFKERFQRFVTGYQVPMDVQTSVRGSLTGELLARCIVETGTSSFYSALRDATQEPVLRALCHRIAGDEFRHYKLFYEYMKTTIKKENVSLWKRLLVAVGRVRESDDDELAFAYHAANEPADMAYERTRCNREYGARAYALYQPVHTERAVNMVMKAVGLNPQGWLGKQAKRFAWKTMQGRAAA